MDILCSESLMIDIEQPLHAHDADKQLKHCHVNRNSSSCSSDCCTESSGTSGTVAASNHNSDSTSDHIDNSNMSKFVYVFTSDGATTTTTTQLTQSVRYESIDEPLMQSSHSHKHTTTTTTTNFTRTPKTSNANSTHNKYLNAHVVVSDPIFKTDRCLENALKSEEKQQIIETYFITVQKDITPPMRKIVAEWMMEVCTEEKCQEEVVLLALSYMDRFLSSKSVRKAHLQILAAACLLLASKLREPNTFALSAELLVFYTDNSINKDDLIKWELFVLSRLGWDLSSVTPLDFLELLIVRLPVKSKNFSDLNIEKVREHAQTFISLAAKEHKFAKYTASTIAASSIAASISGLKWNLSTGQNINFLLSLLTDLTSVGQDQLQQCMIQMEAIFKEHSRNLQPYFVAVEKPPTLKGYYNNNRYAQQQYQYQKPIMSSVMPNLSQTCKMQAQAAKELHEIEF